MDKKELSGLVAQILEALEKERTQLPPPEQTQGREAPAGECPAACDPVACDPVACDPAEDLTAVDLRQVYLVDAPAAAEAYLQMKRRTPARLGQGRAGLRYKTQSYLRFRADHAAAMDAVFSQVSEDFARQNGLVELKTRCDEKEQYLTRPDLGRRLDEPSAGQVRALFPQPPRVLLVVGDGLSAAAVQTNAADCLAAIRDGLRVQGVEAGQGLFIRYCRVGAGDDLGSITGCELVCMLVGERPGLVTDASMSAYITYEPRRGVLESSRTVVSNIHAQGTPAAEAGAHIAQLITDCLKNKRSGVAPEQAR